MTLSVKDTLACLRLLALSLWHPFGESGKVEHRCMNDVGWNTRIDMQVARGADRSEQSTVLCFGGPPKR